MSLFEFVAGMISVILALSVAQLFLGVARLIQRPGHVRFFVPHAVWNANLFMITFIHWWSLWDFRDLSWTFPMFFLTLLGPSLMFFASTVINPRHLTNDRVELETHFFEVRRPFMIVFIAMMVAISIDGPLFGTEEPFNSLRLGQTLVTGAAVWGLFSTKPGAHAIAAVGALLVIVFVTFVRFIPGVIA